MMTTHMAPTASRAEDDGSRNGPALAALFGAGIGAFAMGLVVVLNEAGIVAAPALYGPAGGVSGRTTIATLVWLTAWGVLHHRWRHEEVEPRRIYAVTLLLVGLGMLGTLPPVWGLL